MSMTTCKECGKEVSTKAAKCPHCGTKLKTGLMKKVLLGVGGFFVFLFIIGLINQPETNTATTAVSKETKQVQKSWIEVSRLSGSGSKKGPTFQLTGAKTRMRYSLTGGSMSMLGVYLVPDGTDIMETGGFPEFMQDGAGEGETTIHGKRGNYYLNATAANGDWLVVVEEYK